MIVDNDNTYIKILEPKENKETKPAVEKSIENKTVVVELPLNEEERAEFELFKKLINS